MRLFVAAAATLALLGSAPALAQPAEQANAEEASPYTVLRENATIPFADRRINGFRVGLDRSLILTVGVNRFFRADLDRSCESDLRFETAIGVRVPRAGTLQRSDYVIIEGRRCHIWGLDEIADPGPVERAAREAAAAEAADAAEDVQ